MKGQWIILRNVDLLFGYKISQRFFLQNSLRVEKEYRIIFERSKTFFLVLKEFS